MTLRSRNQTNLDFVYEGDVHVKTGGNYIPFYGVLSSNDIKLYSSDPCELNTSAEIRMTFKLDLIKEIRKDDSRKASSFPTIILLSQDQFKQDDARLRADSKTEQENWYTHLQAVKFNKFEGMLPGQEKDIRDKIERQKTDDYVPMSPQSPTPPSPPPYPPPKTPTRRPSTASTMPYYEPTQNPVEQQSSAYEEPIKTENNLPRWYSNLRMSRAEAEKVLNSNTGPGNMMIRHREKEEIWTHAVSIKEEEGVFRHYKLKKVGAQYHVLLTRESHPELRSLQAVMEFFETRSGGIYKPLDLLDSQEYATYFKMREPVLDDRHVYLNDESEYMNP